MYIDNIKYELLAVIHHHRTQKGDNQTRHYTSTVKYLHYFHINDSIVELQREEDLDMSQTGYIILYRQLVPC